MWFACFLLAAVAALDATGRSVFEFYLRPIYRCCSRELAWANLGCLVRKQPLGLNAAAMFRRDGISCASLTLHCFPFKIHLTPVYSREEHQERLLTQWQSMIRTNWRVWNLRWTLASTLLLDRDWTSCPLVLPTLSHAFVWSWRWKFSARFLFSFLGVTLALARRTLYNWLECGVSWYDVRFLMIESLKQPQTLNLLLPLNLTWSMNSQSQLRSMAEQPPNPRPLKLILVWILVNMLIILIF